MILGVTFPTPGHLHGIPQPQHLALLKGCGFTHIRYNIAAHRIDQADITRVVVANGLQPFPILDYADDTRQPMVTPAVFGTRVAVCLAQHEANGLTFDYAEVGNEPIVGFSRFDPRLYAEYVLAAGEVARVKWPHLKLLAAADFDANAGRWFRNFWPKVLKHLPSGAFDGIAVHPYRNPKVARWSTFKSRAEEFAFLRGYSDHTPLHITEVGWKPHDRADGEVGQAAQVMEEIAICRAADVASCFIYTHSSGEPAFGPFDFGLFHADADNWTPRQVVHDLRRTYGH